MNDKLLTRSIVEALERNGALQVEDLYKQVERLHGDMGDRFFNRVLMTLELQGLIRVIGLAKEKRRVELLRG
jgi:Fe2+ or Zn2+ uptake regulation protein